MLSYYNITLLLTFLIFVKKTQLAFPCLVQTISASKHISGQDQIKCLFDTFNDHWQLKLQKAATENKKKKTYSFLHLSKTGKVYKYPTCGIFFKYHSYRTSNMNESVFLMQAGMTHLGYDCITLPTWGGTMQGSWSWASFTLLSWRSLQSSRPSISLGIAHQSAPGLYVHKSFIT